MKGMVSIVTVLVLMSMGCSENRVIAGWNEFEGKTVVVSYSELDNSAGTDGVLKDVIFYNHSTNLVRKDRYFRYPVALSNGYFMEINMFYTNQTNQQDALLEKRYRLYTLEWALENGVKKELFLYDTNQVQTERILTYLYKFYQTNGAYEVSIFPESNKKPPYITVARYTREWVLQHQYTNSINYYDEGSNLIKQHRFYTKKSADKDGCASMMVYFEKGKRVRQEQFYTSASVNTDGIVRSMFHLNAQGKLEKQEQFLSDRMFASKGFYQVNFYFDSAGQKQRQEHLYTANSSKAKGFDREVFQFDGKGRLVKVSYYLKGKLTGTD